MDFIFWRFVGEIAHHHGTEHVSTPLIVLSILNAIMASYVAYTIVDRIKVIREQRKRFVFLIIGALSMGFGVWAMHFTAMQACDFGFEVSYDIVLTLVSILPAIVGSFFALQTMSNEKAYGSEKIHFDAIYMALGIGTMHYVGMEAIRAKAHMGYDLFWFVISIISAYGFALISLYIKKFRIFLIGTSNLVNNFMCAVVMGFAVSCMHYVAMYAVTFVPDYSIVFNTQLLSLQPTVFAPILFLSVVIILSAVSIAVFFEQALSSNRELLSTVLSVTPSAVIAVDNKGQVRIINGAAKKIFRYRRGDYIPVDEGLIGESTINDLENVISQSPKIYQNCNVKRLDGSVFPAEIMAVKVEHDIDEIMVITFYDLTALKQAESKVLENSKMASLGRMASGLAHEINTPLGTIIMRSSQIQRLLASEKLNPEQVMKLNSAVSASGSHIESIIKGLRAFSRGSEKDPFLATSIGDIVDSTLSLCSASIENKGIEIIVENKAHDSLIECRKSQICQILLNLLENAKFAVLSENTEPKHIWLKIDHLDDDIIFRVVDNGPGVSKENRSRILEPFFTTKTVGEGTGLGLSISKGIAESHYGTLNLDLSENLTTFVLRLPQKHVPREMSIAS